MNSVLIFPGQGSQFLGMGIDLIENFPFLNKYIEITEEITKFNIRQLLNDEELIAKTEYSQILIFLHSALCLIAMEKEFGFDVEKNKFTAGHSLGEYSALFCSKAISFEDGIKILKDRGAAMSKSQEKQSSCGMASILGEVSETSIEKCINSMEKYKNEIFIANFNSENQIVVSGSLNAINEFQENASNFDIKKIIKLPVSGAFHSNFMKDASDIFKQNLDNLTVNKPLIPIIMNYDADQTQNIEKIRENLLKNITSQVKWHQSMEFAKSNRVTKFIQIGGRDILAKMLKRSRVGNETEILSFSGNKDILEIK